jgi:hypothetical protein
MTPPKLILILSENWTMASPRDLPSLVRFAVEAEDARADRLILGLRYAGRLGLGPRAISCCT